MRYLVLFAAVLWGIPAQCQKVSNRMADWYSTINKLKTSTHDFKSGPCERHTDFDFFLSATPAGLFSRTVICSSKTQSDVQRVTYDEDHLGIHYAMDFLKKGDYYVAVVEELDSSGDYNPVCPSLLIDTRRRLALYFDFCDNRITLLNELLIPTASISTLKSEGQKTVYQVDTEQFVAKVYAFSPEESYSGEMTLESLLQLFEVRNQHNQIDIAISKTIPVPYGFVNNNRIISRMEDERLEK
jgi:hypothetical protein